MIKREIKMSKTDRQKEIIELLKIESFISVADLSKRLYASQPTVRRDLDSLEKRGIVRRNHGGAVLCENEISSPVSFRKKMHSKQKSDICRMASTLIPPDSLVFADASSTALHLCEYIKPSDNVTVVTNGIPLFKALTNCAISAILTGGSLVESSQALVGGAAERTVTLFNADVMFFSSSALGEDGMISDYSEKETALRFVMCERSQKTVFLCDGTKFDRASSYCLMPLSDADYTVTDTPLADSLLKSHNLILVDTDGGAYLYAKK